jgi:uncharacterized membrane protein
MINGRILLWLTVIQVFFLILSLIYAPLLPVEADIGKVGADQVWVNSQMDRRSVKITVLDIGMSLSYRDITYINGASKVIAAENFPDRPPEGYHGHGVHILGVAAGTGFTEFLDSDMLSAIAQPLIRRGMNDEAPLIAGNGTHLVVVWHGYISENWDIWYTVYDGFSWSPPIRLTTDPHMDMWPYVTLLSNNRILVAWESDRTGRQEIWYKVFTDGKWTEDKKLIIHIGDSNRAPAFTELNDGDIAFLWSSAEFRSNITNVWFAKLSMQSDGTIKLVEGSERKLTAAHKDTWLLSTCILLTNYGRLYAFWHDHSKYNSKTYWGGVTTMYYGYSDDSGNNWSSGVMYSCDGCIAPYGIQLKNGTIVVFYQGDDLVHNVMDTVYYLRLNTTTSLWEGPFWLPSDVWHRWRPSAAHGPAGLYVVFTVPGKPWEYYYNDIYIIMPQKIEKELFLFKAGATHYEIRLLPEEVILIYLEPDMWQGNSDVYPLTGGKRVGHHHSQLELLGAVHPPQFLIDFKVLEDRGKIVAYSGKWGYRDYFESAATHYIWAEDGLLYRYVKTNLTVLRDIDYPVEAIWVALANDPDYYATAVANTSEGLVTYDMRGTRGHALREYTLKDYGWIALINPLSEDVKGSPALVLVRSTHEVHPTVCNCPNTDNIEIHLLGKDEKKMLRKGDYFELHYLLIVSAEPNSYSWIDEAIKRAKIRIELIDRGELEKVSERLQFNPADDLEGLGMSVDDPDSPTGRARYAHAGEQLKDALVFGPYLTLPPGNYNVRFLLKIDKETPYRVATVDVCTDIGKTVIVSRDISGSEFKEAGKYQWFILNFMLNKTTPNIEFRVWYRPEGGTGLYVGLIEVLAAITVENIMTKETAAMVEKTETETVTVTIQTTDSTTIMFTVGLTAALTLVLIIMLVRRRAIARTRERFQHAVSDELLRRAKLVELERLRIQGKISEEAYRRLREEYEEELKK